jgi:hypothetical protein
VRGRQCVVGFAQLGWDSGVFTVQMRAHGS